MFLLNNLRFVDAQISLTGLKVADMSVTETSAIWNDGASLAESGNFQDAVTKFIALQGQTCHLAITSGKNLFNIGQMYFALRKLDQAAQL